jgi:hypothetical protein
VVYGALRSGRAYLAIDSLAPARGFRFWAEASERGTAEMGDETAVGEWVFHIRTPRAARLALLRDGEQVGGTSGTVLEHWSDEPGVYRVEAYMDAHGRERTWILSNPIYVRA